MDAAHPRAIGIAGLWAKAPSPLMPAMAEDGSGAIVEQGAGASVYRDGVTVVVCTFNRQAMLRTLAESILPQLPVAYPLEILVVDNNSTDDTASVARALAADHAAFTYLFEPRQGLSHARNAGAAAARHGFLLYLDDDAVLPPHYLATLGRRLAEHDPDFFGGPLYPLYLDPKPDWFPESLEIRKKAARSGFDANIVLTGANYGVRKSVLQKVGGFDPHYGMSGGKVGMLEERLVIETYRRLTPARDQKIYYGLDNFILNATPAKRMRVGFQLKRIWIGNAQFMRYCLEQGIRSPGLVFERVWRAFWGELLTVGRAAPGLWRGRAEAPDKPMLALVKLTYRGADLMGALGFFLGDFGRVRRRRETEPREARPLQVTLFTLAKLDTSEPPDVTALRDALGDLAVLQVLSIAGKSDDDIRNLAGGGNLRAQDLILTDTPKAARALSVLRGPRPHLQIVLWMRDPKPVNYLKNLRNFWDKRRGAMGRLVRDRALFAQADQVIAGGLGAGRITTRPRMGSSRRAKGLASHGAPAMTWSAWANRARSRTRRPIAPRRLSQKFLRFLR